jgi:hypothetical protein
MRFALIELFPIRKDPNMKSNYNLRCLAAVLIFMSWSALQSWGQTELIQNGGFESGAANWTMAGGAIADNTSGFSRSGSFFLFLGGVVNEVDSCYQTITIPAGASSATLSFYYNILSAESPVNSPFDFFHASIRNTGNVVLATVLSKSNVDQDSNSGPAFYHQQTFNLLPFAGQTVRIYFDSSNDSSLESYFLVDDVSVQVVAGGGNQRPVANPQNLSVNYNASLPITLTATDGNNDPLTYSIATAPSHGGLSGTPPNVTYQPNFNYSGPDSFTFTANDGQTNSAPATISITVNPPLAGLIINPVWDTTILNDPNAATIMNTISNTVLVYETKFSDNVTVTIKFAEMASGLGQSSTFVGTVPYANFYNALVADSKTTNDVTALANIPLNGGINPVDLSSSIRMTTANQRALGFSADPPPGSPDSTISLNISLINIDRVSINPSKYDLMAVVSHEIDEALGSGSGLTRPNAAPVDLFRYDSFGARNFTTSGDNAGFSINGGTTRLVQYNQSASGDYGDWWSTGAHTPRVQDAFGTPGAILNLGVELTVLDVIGWDLVIPAPTPAIQGVSRIGNTINFSWASAVGHGYQVQYKTNLTQVNWLNLNSPITAVGSVTSSSDTIGPDPRRFYRIALLTSSPAPPTAPLVTLPSTGPYTLVTNYFLPEQAAGMKGQAVKSFPAKPFKAQAPNQAPGQN